MIEKEQYQPTYKQSLISRTLSRLLAVLHTPNREHAIIDYHQEISAQLVDHFSTLESRAIELPGNYSIFRVRYLALVARYRVRAFVTVEGEPIEIAVEVLENNVKFSDDVRSLGTLTISDNGSYAAVLKNMKYPDEEPVEIRNTGFRS